MGWKISTFFFFFSPCRNYGGVYVGLPADLTTVASSQSKSTRKGKGGACNRSSADMRNSNARKMKSGPAAVLLTCGCIKMQFVTLKPLRERRCPRWLSQSSVRGATNCPAAFWVLFANNFFFNIIFLLFLNSAPWSKCSCCSCCLTALDSRHQSVLQQFICAWDNVPPLSSLSSYTISCFTVCIQAAFLFYLFFYKFFSFFVF